MKIPKWLVSGEGAVTLLLVMFLVVVIVLLTGCAMETYVNSDGFVFSITKDQAL